MTYLKRHPKTGIYVFRRAIPAELRPFLGRGREWTESLKTKSAIEAKSLVQGVAARVEALFQQAREQAVAKKAETETPSHLTTPVILAVVRSWKEQELFRRAQAVLADPLASWDVFNAEVALFNCAAEGMSAAAGAKGFFANVDRRERLIDGKVREITQAAGLVVSVRHPAWAVFWHLVQDAWGDILVSEGRWRNFDFQSMPAAEPSPNQTMAVPSTSGQKTRPQDTLCLSQALEVWAEGGGVRGAKKPAQATVQEARAALTRFVELHGDLPIGAISRKHGREFRDAIARLPRRLPSNLAKLPLPDLLKRDLSGFPVRSAKTLNKSLTLLGAVLSRADRDGHFDGGHWRNPFDVGFTVEPKEDDGFEPFTVAELNKLLSSPVFSEGERPKRGRGCTGKWAPLMALFHGARRGEVLQLFVRDVVQDHETGVWVVRFNRDAGKAIKTSSSIRETPLHPRFAELGFLSFVEQRRNAVGADASLWPGFEDRTKLDSRMNKWGEWFGAYLAEHVVDAQTKSFHSFRATFKRFGHACHVSEPALDRLVGHVIPGVGAQYGKQRQRAGGRDTGFPLPRLADEISKVRFDGVDFSLVK